MYLNIYLYISFLSHLYICLSLLPKYNFWFETRHEISQQFLWIDINALYFDEKYSALRSPNLTNVTVFILTSLYGVWTAFIYTNLWIYLINLYKTGKRYKQKQQFFNQWLEHYRWTSENKNACRRVMSIL